MTQDDHKLDQLLTELNEHKASADLKERILNQAYQTPQEKPFKLFEHINTWFEALSSPWPCDLGIKTASLACIAIVCFTTSLFQPSIEMDVEDIDFVAAVYSDFDEMEMY